MKSKNVQYILSDIEGTTTSVKFVYDVLFPYFRAHIDELKKMSANEIVQNAFQKTIYEANSVDGIKLKTIDDIIKTLLRWSEEDRKMTPLKTLQGILWKKGYQNKELKGHVYNDVMPNFKKWTSQGMKVGIFSSGSVEAQKLIFKHSDSGDLTPFISHYFDTETGSKRDSATYSKIAMNIDQNPDSILFLSDVVAELEAADKAGFQTIQLIRPETIANWHTTVSNFDEIRIS